MLYITLYDDNCKNDDVSQCPNVRYYSLRAIAAAFGSFDADEFTNGFAAFLFVIFAVTTVLVIFNAFVATAVDSYSRWIEKSDRCSGRARSTYVIELQAVQNLLGGEWTLMQYCTAILIVSIVIVIFILSIDSIRISMVMNYGNSLVAVGIVVLLVFLLISATSFLSHLNFQNAPRRIDVRSSYLAKFCSTRVVTLVGSPANFCIRKLFCLEDELHRHRKKGQWKGNLAQMRNDFRQSSKESEERLNSDLMRTMQSMENRLKMSEQNGRQDILLEMRAVETRLQKLLDDFNATLFKATTSNPAAGRSPVRIDPKEF